jgi:hypothetical protein
MKLLLLVVIALSSGIASAAGYGDAGCGLGSIVFGSKQGFTQVFAATTNGTFGSQTFGISSGTSNCGGSGREAMAFIEVNKSSLKNDIAKGYGETVNSLAEIYSCKNVEQFGKTLQTNYKEVFESNDSQVISMKINTIIEKNNVSCKPVV